MHSAKPLLQTVPAGWLRHTKRQRCHPTPACNRSALPAALLTLLMQELAPLRILPAGRLRLDQLQDERPPRDNIGAARQEVATHLRTKHKQAMQAGGRLQLVAGGGLMRVGALRCLGAGCCQGMEQRQAAAGAKRECLASPQCRVPHHVRAARAAEDMQRDAPRCVPTHSAPPAELTSASSTLDLPLLWLPTTAICGRSSLRSGDSCAWGGRAGGLRTDVHHRSRRRGAAAWRG